MIRKEGNQILTKKCKPVTKENYKSIGNRFLMRTIPHRTEGLGFAGNQLGVPYQIFAMKRKGILEVMMNPKILEFTGKMIKVNEGCLSIPNKRFEVKRFTSLVLEYRNKNFDKVVVKIEDFLHAQIVQHEVDHLNGVLISNHGSII